MDISTIDGARNSDALRTKIELVYGDLSATGAQVVNHPDARKVYPHFLVALYSLTRASVPLMEWALAESRLRAPGDESATLLAEYFRSHIPEEVGHDIWILEDLEAMGFNREKVRLLTPSPTAARLIGAQYYWAKFCHPVALLGYMEIAEAYPPTLSTVAELKKGTGFGDDCFRALRRHASIDLEHREDLHRLLDSLVLTREQEQLVSLSALTSIDLLIQLFNEVLSNQDEKPPLHILQ